MPPLILLGLLNLLEMNNDKQYSTCIIVYEFLLCKIFICCVRLLNHYILALILRAISTAISNNTIITK